MAMIRFASLAALALLSVSPAVAQQGSTDVPDRPDRINQVMVFGDDPCAADDGSGDIIVCMRLAEEERYRIPPALRGNPNDPARESWTARVQSFERVGRFGTDSCSPVGLGGFTGCLNQMVDSAYAERAQAAGTDWTDAVAAQRQQRMEGFDAEARAVEEQVLADERARIAREQAAEAAAENVDAEPLPVPPPR